MIFYPSMSHWCQWNIAPWAHISFPPRRRAPAGSWERGPGTEFKHHFTTSNKGANGRDGREGSVTWKGCRRWMGSFLLAIWWLLVPCSSFCQNTWNGPSSLSTTANNCNIFSQCFKIERQTFLWKIVSFNFKNSSHSFIQFIRASPKEITKWHIEIEYS